MCVVDGSQLILGQLPLPYKTRMPRAILPSVTSSSSLFLCSTSDLTRFLFYSVPVPVDNSTTHLSPILSLVYIYIYSPALYHGSQESYCLYWRDQEGRPRLLPRYVFTDPAPPPYRVKAILVSLWSRIFADSFDIDMIKDAIVNVSGSRWM